MEVKCTNAGKDVLLNPNVGKMKQEFPCLRKLPFSEKETKDPNDRAGFRK